MKIPPNLAYGDKGAGAAIPPGSHIQFECELKRVASNPIEAFLATRKLEVPYITLTILAAALLYKLSSGGL